MEQPAPAAEVKRRDLRPLTVILAVPARASSSVASLRALAAQQDGEVLLERVVLVRAGATEPDPIPPELGDRVVILEQPPSASEPVLWLAGLTLAATEYVVFLDSLSLPQPDWARQITNALRGGSHVVGGAVEPDLAAGARSGWAAFLCDYGAFLPPLGPRSAGDREGLPSLPGNNIAFRTDALRAVLADRPDGGLRKSLLLPELAARGAVIRRVPGAKIRLRSSGASFGATLLERFARGRAYAGLNSGGWSRSRRLARVLGMPLVPLVMTARLERDLRGKPAARRVFLRSLPACLALQAAWALGEGVGMIRGPGDVSRVR